MKENSKKDWMKYYKLAEIYHEHHGNLEIPTNFKTVDGYTFKSDGKPLGRWINFQRQSYKNHTPTPLTEDRIKLLNNIGMVWDAYQNEWMKKYNLVCIYMIHHGTNRIPFNFKTLNGIQYDESGIKIGQWLSIQRRIMSGSLMKELTEEQKRLLNEINIMESSWKQNYELARIYYEANGSLLMPNDFTTNDGIHFSPNGVKLGKWVKTQKYNYFKKDSYLTKEQKDLLSLIGIEINLLDKKWITAYNLACKYYEFYGNLEVPNPFKTKNGYEKDEDGYNLGAWISWHRYDYKRGNVTQERINLLKKIGMRFEVKEKPPKGVLWKENYELARVYYNYHGNLEIPQKFKTKDGYTYDECGWNLGIWINDQRNKYRQNKLSKERYDLLSQIGMRFTLIKPLSWEKNYALLSKYQKKYQTAEVPSTFKTSDGFNYDKDGFKLGSWVDRQRFLARKKMLSKDRIEKLEKIGFRFQKYDIDTEWMNKYNLAKIYHEHHGNLKIPYNFKTIDGYTYHSSGVDLGSWITSIRQSFKGQHNNYLDYSRIKLLDEIGMSWYKEEYNIQFQSEEINDKNKIRKQKELLNRFKRVLNEFNDDYLPTKEEINKEFIRKLK